MTKVSWPWVLYISGFGFFPQFIPWWESGRLGLEAIKVYNDWNRRILTIEDTYIGFLACDYSYKQACRLLIYKYAHPSPSPWRIAKPLSVSLPFPSPTPSYISITSLSRTPYSILIGPSGVCRVASRFFSWSCPHWKLYDALHNFIFWWPLSHEYTSFHFLSSWYTFERFKSSSDRASLNFHRDRKSWGHLEGRSLVDFQINSFWWRIDRCYRWFRRFQWRMTVWPRLKFL